MPSSLTQLLAKLLDNVNLGKILVDGGPGVLLALAILLLACQSIREDPVVTPLITTKTSLMLPLEVSHCTANDDIDKNGLKRLPFLRLVLQGDIDRTKTQIEKCEEEYAAVAGSVAGQDQQLQNLAKKIALVEQSRVHIGPTPAACASDPLCGDLYAQAVKLRQAKADHEKQLEIAAKELDDLRTRLEKKRQEHVRDGRVLLSELINLLLGLSIFGYVLGTLFSGLNRTVWLLWFQQIVVLTLGWIWDRVCLIWASSADEMAKIAIQRKLRLVELKLGTAVVVPSGSKKRMVQNLTTTLTYFDAGRKYSPVGISQIDAFLDAMDGPEAPVTLPITYFLGRGIISQQDYDSFVTGYYRWAEASANLILPVLALGYAIQCCIKGLVLTCDSGAACLNWLQKLFNWFEWHPFCTAWILAILLYIAAQLLYGDYKRRLRNFVLGKLDSEEAKKKEQAEAEKQKPIPAPSSPKSGRQRVEIIVEGEQMAGLVKMLEQILQGNKGG